MRIATLNKDGVCPVITRTVYPTESGKNTYYCIAHGTKGVKTWEFRIPLFSPHFPHDENKKTFDLDRDDYTLYINRDRKDPQGNPQIIINQGDSDNRWLILLDIEPYPGGSGFYSVSGEASVLAKGMDITEGCDHPFDKPIICVDGPCKIVWVRDGNSRDHDYRAWEAVYDGTSWSIYPHYDNWKELLRKLSQEHRALAG